MIPPSDLAELLRRPVSDIHAFDGLAIDAAIWEEAHNYHTLHRHLHLLGSHRPGILAGLEVVLSDTEPDRITVTPGIGIDRQGNLLLLTSKESIRLQDQGVVYILLAFNAVNDERNSRVVVTGGGNEYFRIIESRDLRATRDLPKTPYLELARLYRAQADAPAKRAANPHDPGSNELNLLHRSRSFPLCFAEGSVGELAYVPQRDRQAGKPNRSGLIHLLQTARQSGLSVDFAGPVNVQRSERQNLLMLYMAGDQPFAPLGDEAVDGLRKLLEEGAVLLGESTIGTGENDEWAAGFSDLAQRLGANMEPMERYVPLLTGHHIFSTPPPGQKSDGILTGDPTKGILFSSRNWGGAWQGGRGLHSEDLDRERIRTAHEWGINLLIWAAQRRSDAALATL